MLFASLQERLILHIRDRVRAGEVTERGLARLTGMSQPHLHNVLKGIRSLSVEYTDQLLVQLNLTVFDLLSVPDSERAPFPMDRSSSSYIEQLQGIAGPGDILQPRPVPGGRYPLPRSLTEPLTDPVLVTLGHDPRLFPHFQAGDLALVTRPPVNALSLDHSAVYLVKTPDGTLVRSLRFGAARLYLITPEMQHEPRKWEQITVRGNELSNIVLGKLVWIERRIQRYPFQAPEA